MVRGGGVWRGGGGRKGERGRELRRQSSPQGSSPFICVSALSDPTISELGTDYAGVQFCGWVVFLIFYCNYFLRLLQFEFSHWNSD